MNRLIVDKSLIIRNCEELKAKKQQYNFSLYVMAKSNLYGFGYELLEHMKDYLDGMVLTGVQAGPHIPAVCDTVIARFQRETISDTYCYTTRLEDEDYCVKANSYVRVDPFLGLHGISMEQLRNKKNLSDYRGLFIYINEFLSADELPVMDELFRIANKHGLVVNVGGSSMLRYLDRFAGQRMELRLLRELLMPKHRKASMYLVCRVLNHGEPQMIGFKSDRQNPTTGKLALISVGYYECKWMSELYKRGIPLTIDGRPCRIPCYPCMNTMWIQSEGDLLSEREIQLFSDFEEVLRICEILDIDVDEFYSAFPMDIPRIYK